MDGQCVGALDYRGIQRKGRVIVGIHKIELDNRLQVTLKSTFKKKQYKNSKFGA